MHPYKGKFHPKMVRALLNYAFPEPAGRVMDNFAGCGTLLVEATWMGIDSTGVEINPLSALMCNIKCDSLSIPLSELKQGIDSYLKDLSSSLRSYDFQLSGSPSHVVSLNDEEPLEKRKILIPARVVSLFSEPRTVDHVIVAHELVKKVRDKKIRDFLLLALSGTTSDLTRRRKGKFLDVLQERLRNLYLRIYIFDELNEVLKIELGKSRTFVADTRDMRMVESESVDAIVNSPPYSTALDYVKNDYPQLVLLELADVDWLEANMIGSPRFKVYPPSLLDEIKSDSVDFVNLPQDARDAVSTLVGCRRTKEAMRTFKFFKDMGLALREMYRVLKRGSKCVIVIGNNSYRCNGNLFVVKNDEILKEMALGAGFKEDTTISRELEKSQAGMIRRESVLILEKPTAADSD
jgi:DNA modification methylase